MIVEDNKYMLEYLTQLFERDGRFAVAAALRDAEEAEAVCEASRAELILMDVQTLDGHSGLSAAESIHRRFPAVRIVVATSLVDAGVLENARRVGADSLWYKDHSEEELTDVAARTLAGERIFPDREPSVALGHAFSDELTEMQKNILRLYIRGNSYSAIGRKLFLEEVTVKYHMNRMIQKCGFKTKQELVAAAIASTVITPQGDR